MPQAFPRHLSTSPPLHPASHIRNFTTPLSNPTSSPRFSNPNNRRITRQRKRIRDVSSSLFNTFGTKREREGRHSQLLCNETPLWRVEEARPTSPKSSPKEMRQSGTKGSGKRLTGHRQSSDSQTCTGSGTLLEILRGFAGVGSMLMESKQWKWK